MKTLKKDGNIIRVMDKEADEKVKRGWQFCPKHEWKTSVRDFNKQKGKKQKDQLDQLPDLFTVSQF